MEAEKATPDHAAGFKIARMARLLGVSWSGYFAWARRQAAGPGPAQQRRSDLTAKSLRTALSRWENGHNGPDRQYRRLFSEIYGLTDVELGFGVDPVPVSDLTEVDLELRQRIAAAARVDRGTVEILQAQTDNIRRLDRRLGAPVLLDQMTAHVTTLRQLLRHAVLDSTRQPIAATLADAAALAGWQALDVGAISRAWECYEIAGEAGRISGCPELLAHARGEQSYALLDLGQPVQALHLVRQARHEAGTAIPVRMTSWLWSAEAELAAAAGLDTDARHALDHATAALPAGPAEDPDLPYLSLDEHHLTRWRGSALARLGDSEAIDQLGRALAGMPAEYIRATSGLHIDGSSDLSMGGLRG